MSPESMSLDEGGEARRRYSRKCRVKAEIPVSSLPTSSCAINVNRPKTSLADHPVTLSRQAPTGDGTKPIQATPDTEYTETRVHASQFKS